MLGTVYENKMKFSLDANGALRMNSNYVDNPLIFHNFIISISFSPVLGWFIPTNIYGILLLYFVLIFRLTVYSSRIMP